MNKPPPWARWGKTICVALGLGLAGYFLASLDLALCAGLLRQLSPLPLGGVLLCIIASAFFRSLRWRLLAGSAMGKKLPVNAFFRAVSVGYLGNMILPAKAGEALRMAYACKQIGLPAGLAVSTGLVDRLLDVIGLLLPIGCILFLLEENPLLRGLRWFFPAVMVLGIAFLAALGLVPERMRSLIGLPARFMPRLVRERMHDAVDKALQVSAAFQSPRAVVGLCLCTMAAIMADCGTCWMLMQAFGWDLPASSAIMMEFGLAVAGSVPSAPGYLGAYQAAAVLTLSLYRIEQSAAVLYAFALQFILLGAFLLLGGSAVLSLRRERTQDNEKKSSLLRQLLAHPLTRDLAVDDPRTSARRRMIIQEKAFLRRLYAEWYDRIMAALPIDAAVSGKILEIGSGGGFFKDRFPECISSEVFALPGIDLVCDGQRLPFASASLRAIVMVDTLHHIPDCGLFFAEAQRVLKEQGRIVMLEPWNSAWGRWIYQHLHHEPFVPEAADWTLTDIAGSGPLSRANGAIPWIVFSREREHFENCFPELRILAIQPDYPFSYLASGGVSMRALAPGWSFCLWRGLERALSPFMPALGMFALIILERKK
ncbi:MAG: flippase-like domain-containing protein [Desulfovibrionaceae bacterium]|nr:flippase-like domain-containing protein [Desulfovibrionaceae bacterium]